MKLLVVAAHPDDEILGCGGTMAKLADEGHHVSCLLLSSGRMGKWQLDDAGRFLSEIIGIRDYSWDEYPDNRFDTVPLLDVVQTIEGVLRTIEPDMIFTHHYNDLNVDHRVTYQAILTACRPVATKPVRQICSFEVLSSTEWQLPSAFEANMFIDVTRTLDRKLKAMREAYGRELQEYPHPRSTKGIAIQAARRGMDCGLQAAEAFRLVRGVW